ncbi:thiol reductant ABC exporter subunit CydC [Paucilactobacillus kaifaensis]|uniref:thiol reductant ABC exporter subunit CydC n=1 Tax=Paucilactobacillus kaifaensis TaxID=2559921 RepID=UPI0010F9B75D|nr:thiol reductant ABC exporter subunit CydC [Paucilactobacillus kaifaensis]
MDVLKNDSWVMPYLRKYKMLLVLVLFLGFLTLFSGSALMFTSGYLISKCATHPFNILLVYPAIVLTRAFGIARPVFRYAERLSAHNWVLRIVSNFRKKLYDSVESTAVAIRQKHQTGSLLTLLADDIEHIENLYLTTVFPIVTGILVYVFIIVGLGVINWPFALLMLLLVGILMFVMPLVSVLVNGANEFKQKQIQQGLYTRLTDSVLGLGDWLISGRQSDFMQQHLTTSNQIFALRRKDKNFQWFRDLLSQIVIGVAAIATLIWAGTTMTNSQNAANWIAAFVLCIFPLDQTFTNIAQGVSEWPTYRESIKRVNALPKIDNLNSSHQEKLQEPFKQLTIDRVNFQYTDSKHLVLQQLNLEVSAGEKIALLGPSGTGKSTLLKLILGDERATEGSININGIDISQLQSERANLFGVLDQQPYLFDTSILNNIRLGNLSATKEQVQKVLDEVELTSLIASLPAGLQTQVQEAGSRFSGGEQQRLALARILLQDAPIIILDEPTVALDPITEQHLLQTIFRVLKDKTVIWVTHHLVGINYVDQVRFIEHGQFDMSGTPKELYANSQRFRRLYEMDRGKV